MDDIAVNFGCQVSRERFSVLWKHTSASVQFRNRLEKVHIFFCYSSVDYKLEISSESIWQIQLHKPSDLTSNFFVLQLVGAPRIYKGDVSTSNNGNQWFREVDFTKSCCIGQSSAICLELPHTAKLPKSCYLYYYSEKSGRFSLERGFSYSRDLNLVPVVTPPESFNLPYKILFKINSLVQHGCLPGPAIDVNFFQLVDPSKIKIEYIESALDKLYLMKNCCYEPVTWLKRQYERYQSSQQIPVPPSISLDDGLVYVHRVQVTPCKIYFCGPEVNLSNRVLRNFHQDIDNFLRVSFVDEDFDKLHSTDLMPHSSSPGANRQTGLYRRVLSTLRNGIIIGSKKFEFLAFSSSQLRDNSLWMFASRNGLTASDIRRWMGDFREIRNVAKYAARLGQSFSSSRETLSVELHEIDTTIPDVEVKRGEISYCFSDGIGKISTELARKVAKKCGCRDSIPSAFQIRYGGYKGVVAVDPTSPINLSLRKSMFKYKSENTKLDVLSWSKYQPCFLNREIITLLSTLGVEDEIFEMKQREVVNQLERILKDPLIAHETLDLMSSGEITNILKQMLSCGYKPDKEPFLSMMLQTFRASKMQELRLKSRIFVPKGRSMLGCLDETRTLEYGEIFVQISQPKRMLLYDNSSLALIAKAANGSKHIVEGVVVVAKNPCLHPGDVRVLQAVNIPALHHMVDCVVFPQKGERPHPNECSGSDLDGDIYFVSWDSNLIPPRQEKPMDYAPAPTMNLDRDVRMEDVEKHFVDYIVNDSLGIIATAHTIFADREPEKAMSPQCIELARLHSVAVDFPKTGRPAEIPRYLRVKDYPDFKEKPNKTSYKSNGIIGKLYREVRNVAQEIKPFTMEMARQLYDSDMEVDGFERYASDAYEYKSMYDYKLRNLMDYYGINTEGEIISGNLLNMSESFDKSKDLEGIHLAMKSLRTEVRAWFGAMKSESSSEGDDTLAKASAWYYVTYHPTYWGCYNEGLGKGHFLSFPWCVYDKLIQIKRAKAKSETSLYIESLEKQYSNGLNLY